MQVRWSPQAAEDLAAIVAHIRKDDPAAAHRTAREIYERAGALKTFPHRGRHGRVKGTRELPLPPLPFIVVYRGTVPCGRNRQYHPWRPTLAIVARSLSPRNRGDVGATGVGRIPSRQFQADSRCGRRGEDRFAVHREWGSW